MIVEKLIKIKYSRGPDTIIKDISLELRAGELSLIRGRSGVGKTSLARIAALLSRPSGGRIIFMGEDITDKGDRRWSSLRLGEIGYIDQEYKMIDEISLLENIILPALLKGIVKKDAVEAAVAYAKRLGIRDLLDRTPGMVSGGQRQRAAIIRALVKKPILVVADEPYSSLDDEAKRLAEEILAEYAAENQAAVLVATTDLLGRYRASTEYFMDRGVLRGTMGPNKPP